MSRRHQRLRVKICGITNREDAEAAIELGADALGFNAFPGSKRFIDLDREGAWISELPPLVMRVAVMVDPTREQAETVFRLPFIDAVQFHGHESPEFLSHFAAHSWPLFKAISLRDEAAIAETRDFGTHNILLDTYSPGDFGGTGRLIDLDIAEKFARAHPELRLILSGGLRPENVAEAVRRVRPFGVDVASGVEREPRRKDVGLMREFIREATGA